MLTNVTVHVMGDQDGTWWADRAHAMSKDCACRPERTSVSSSGETWTHRVFTPKERWGYIT